MPNNNQNLNQNNNQTNNQNINTEFGSETDINEIKQKIQQAEAKKQQASILKNNGFQNE